MQLCSFSFDATDDLCKSDFFPSHTVNIYVEQCIYGTAPFSVRFKPLINTIERHLIKNN